MATRSGLKTEHADAKSGGGYYGRRAHAKAESRIKHRHDDKAAASGVMSTRKRQSRRLPGYETTREAGARLSVHADTVRRWCERKLILGAFKPPGMKHYRVPIDASKPDDAVPPLTVREAAARLKISENEVRDMCESGEVAGARRQPGGHWRMPFASAQAAAAARVALRLAAVEAAAAAQAAFRAVVRAGIIRRRKIA